MREFDLLSHVYDANAVLPGSVLIPPGDDMGALELGTSQVLVTVDQLADGVHVDLATASLSRVGRKAITRNLSDVAAMGATPCGAVVAVSLPMDFGQQRATELFDAMRQTAMYYDCPLFGGDISMWDGKLLISVTVLAKAQPGQGPILRKGAQPGDVICVTGKLGGSMQDVDGQIHHLDFEPRLVQGRHLATDAAIRPNCMIDLSDGLSRDLGHLCDASGLGASIELENLPLSKGALDAAHKSGWPAWYHALADGEDYELCMTLPASKFAAMACQVEGVPVTAIGVMTQDPERLCIDGNGKTFPLDKLGWEHHGR